MSEAGGTDKRPKYVIFGEYLLGDQIGAGSFGDVFKCTQVRTGKQFAVKRFKTKFPNEKAAMEENEIQILQQFQVMHYKGRKGAHCSYVMKAERIAYENKRLYLVFPLMDMSLTQYIRMRATQGRLDEQEEIRLIMKQILIGLRYLHEEMKIMHRDLKPDNILVTLKPLQIKIIDFGTCKDLNMWAPPHTPYKSTRWYRAPECVLRSRHYKLESDVFAAGCIMGELYLQRPLFPGTSELDQLDKIFRILGTPKKEQWKEGYRLAEQKGISFKTYSKKSLKSLLEGISDPAEEALKVMLRFSSNKRGTASQILNMPFFVDLVTPSTQESKYLLSQEPSVSSPHQNYQIPHKHRSYLAHLSRADDRSSHTRRAGARNHSSFGNSSSQSGLIGSLDSRHQEEHSFVAAADDRSGHLVNNRHFYKSCHSQGGDKEDFDSDSSNSGTFVAQVSHRKEQGHFSVVREPTSQLAQLPQVSQVKGTIRYRNQQNNSVASRASQSNSQVTLKEEQHRPAKNTFFRPEQPQQDPYSHQPLPKSQPYQTLKNSASASVMFRSREASNRNSLYESASKPIDIFRPTSSQNEVNLSKVNAAYHQQNRDPGPGYSVPSYEVHQAFTHSQALPIKSSGNQNKSPHPSALDRKWREITPQSFQPIQQFLNHKEPGLSSLSPTVKRISPSKQQPMAGSYIKFPNKPVGSNESRFNRTTAIPKRKEGWTINVSPDRNFIDVQPPSQRQSPAYFHQPQFQPPPSVSSQELFNNEESFNSKYESQVQETLPAPYRQRLNGQDPYQSPNHPNPYPGKSYKPQRSGVAGIVPGSSMGGRRQPAMGPGEKVQSMVQLRRMSNAGGY